MIDRGHKLPLTRQSTMRGDQSGRSLLWSALRGCRRLGGVSSAAYLQTGRRTQGVSISAARDCGVPTKAATYSNLMAASLVLSHGPVLIMSWRRSPGQVFAQGLG
jgi:hypothetical protein